MTFKRGEFRRPGPFAKVASPSDMATEGRRKWCFDGLKSPCYDCCCCCFCFFNWWLIDVRISFFFQPILDFFPTDASCFFHWWICLLIFLKTWWSIVHCATYWRSFDFRASGRGHGQVVGLWWWPPGRWDSLVIFWHLESHDSWKRDLHVRRSEIPASWGWSCFIQIFWLVKSMIFAG